MKKVQFKKTVLNEVKLQEVQGGGIWNLLGGYGFGKFMDYMLSSDFPQDGAKMPSSKRRGDY